MSNSHYRLVTFALPGSPVPYEVLQEMYETSKLMIQAAINKEYGAPIEIGFCTDASETNSNLDDAMEMYGAKWSDPDLPVRFLNTIQRLPSKDRKILAGILKADHMAKYGGEADKPMTPLVVCAGSSSSCGVPEKVQNSAGAGDGFIMKTAVPAMIGAAVKTASDTFFAIVGEPSIDPELKPYVEVATVGGIVLLCSAAVLMGKKPWLSKIMVKLGALAIAFSTLLPMTLALPPVMAVVFGLLVAVILVGTAAIV